MKKLLLIAVACVLTGTLSAQNAIEKYYAKYNDQEDITKIHITGKMFDLMQEVESEDEDFNEIKDVALQVDELNVIISEDMPEVKQAYSGALKVLGKEFEELMTVQDNEGDLACYIKENSGVIAEVLIIAHGRKEFLIASLTGNIDLSKVGPIMAKAQMGHYTEKTSIDQLDTFKVYPNPVNKGDQMTVDLPEELIGAQIEVYDLNGRNVLSQQVVDRTEFIGTGDLTKGQYILKVEREDFRITRKFAVQ